MDSFKYKAFGVVFSLPFPIENMEQFSGKPEIIVTYGETPLKLENILKKGVLFQVNADEFLFQFDGVGRYWVKGKNKIVITKNPDATNDDISVFLFSSVFAYVLQTRGGLTLHSNVIHKNNQAFLIAGNSGAGKSTLTYSLLQKGYSFFSDDICVVSFNKENKPFSSFGLPRLKLWQDTLEHFSVQKNGLRPIRSQLKKFYYPIAISKNVEKLEIKKMITLSTHNKEEIVTEKLSGVEKFNALKANTYRYQFLSEKMGIKPHFVLSSKFANNIEIYRITRPNFDFKVDALQQEAEKIFRG